jgi:hypothetical protein
VSDTYEQARRNLELAAVSYFWELNPQLARSSKEMMVDAVVRGAIRRLV